MTHALSPRLYADLLDKPFEDGARGPDSFDCVGLVCEVLRRSGVDVPAFVSSEAELHRQLAGGGILNGASPIPHAEPGCVVLLRMLGGDHHVAIMVDAYRLLHTSAQTGRPVIERILSPLLQRRIVGFYLVDAGNAITQVADANIEGA